MAQGAFALLTKPYNREQLRGTLSRAIGVKVLTTRVETAESALVESEDRFQSVVQSAINAIILADQRGNIIFWNKAAARMFLYTDQEIIGQSLTKIMPDRYREAHERGLRQFGLTGDSRIMGKSIELQGLRKDGVEIPLELSLGTWKIGSQTYYCGIIREITERKHMEQVQAEQLRLASLQDAILEFCRRWDLRDRYGRADHICESGGRAYVRLEYGRIDRTFYARDGTSLQSRRHAVSRQRMSHSCHAQGRQCVCSRSRSVLATRWELFSGRL